MMQILILIGLAGALFGTRLPVQSLLAPLAVILTGVPIVGALLGVGFIAIFQMVIASVVALQLGYLGGSIARILIVSAHNARILGTRSKFDRPNYPGPSSGESDISHIPR